MQLQGIIPFDSPSVPMLIGNRLAIELIRKGAFNTHNMKDVKALYAHDRSQLLGRTSSGTLRIWQSQQGLEFALDLPNTSLGNHVGQMVARGDLFSASFGFNVRTNGDNWTPLPSGGYRRELLSVDLNEVSIIPDDPAYPNARLFIPNPALANKRKRQMLAEIL